MKEINLKTFFMNFIIFSIIKNIFGDEICSKYIHYDKICNTPNIFFNDNHEIEIECGNGYDYFLDDNQEIKIEFGNEDGYFLNKSPIHCNYEITNNNNNYDIFLSIQKYTYNINDGKKLNYEINIILPNSTVFHYNNHNYKQKLLNLCNINSFTLKIDIEQIQFTNNNYYIDGGFTINIYKTKKKLIIILLIKTPRLKIPLQLI